MTSERELSLAEAKSLGYPINPNLPMLDNVEQCRSTLDITDRLLCLYAVVASSYGFPKERALLWLQREGVVGALSRKEHEYLFRKNEENQDMIIQWQVEALWALAWCIGCHQNLDFGDSCSDSFIQILPDIAKDTPTKEFRRGLRLRKVSEIVQKTDLAYCLHWAIREAELKGLKTPGKVPSNVVVERRRALEWVIGQDGWDELQLDT